MCYPRLFTDYAKNYEPGKHYVQGSSPTILKEFIAFLDENADEIEEINICMFLYNNPVLHKKMKELAGRKIPVNIISIPLEGYDSAHKYPIYNLEDGSYCGEWTKFTAASNIYCDIANAESTRYKLFIFPHLYVRSKKFRNFSRGKLPYSLHSKNFFIRFKDKSGIVGITSSNMAVCDDAKNEIMVLQKMDSGELVYKQTDFFFDLLKKNSVPLTSDSIDYSIEKSLKYSLNHKYTGSNTMIFMAPFLENSPVNLDNRLAAYVNNARTRIYISAQHIACDGNERTLCEKPKFLKKVFEKAQNGDVSVHALSQTYTGADGRPHGQRGAVNTSAFKRFTLAVNSTKNVDYIINRDTHAKFIIIDKIAIITTFNFTPTQFIYEEVNIDEFEMDKTLSYRGIHAEVGVEIEIKSDELCNQLIGFFETIRSDNDTYIHVPEVRHCPRCSNGSLVLKTGQYGIFIGCDNYPSCNYTEKI